MDWTVVTYRVPQEPSRHRVAIWRELRRAGAVPLQQATWALPLHRHTAKTLDRVRSLVGRADGQVFIFDADPRDDAMAADLDEEEQNLERLRRWHAELRERDVLGAPSAAEAEIRLKASTEQLESF